jgi:hypothetical protein
LRPPEATAGIGTVKHPNDYGIFVILYLVVSVVAGPAVACRIPKKDWSGLDE